MQLRTIDEWAMNLLLEGPFGSAPALPTYPTTGAEATSLLGVTLTSLYLCDETSGNVSDQVSTNHLVAAGTPTFRRTLPDGSIGIYYDNDGDTHLVSANTFGAGSGWYAAAFEPVANPGALSAGIIGLLNTSGASDGTDIRLIASNGFPNLFVADSGSNSLSVSGSTDIYALGGIWLAQLQIDRAANTARARFSRYGGPAIALSGSIAGFAALDNVLAMEFGFGTYGARLGGNAIGWAATAFGAQCEGAGFLAANAVAMRFE